MPSIVISALPRNFLVYICRHVFDRTRPVLLVTHDDDGALCTLCGFSDHSTDPNVEPPDFRGVGLGQLTAADPSLTTAPPIPVGWIVERRAPTEGWELLPRETGAED
jgi:hypothetical protein